MEHPQFNFKLYNQLVTNPQKSAYLRAFADKLDKYDLFLKEQEKISMDKLREKYLNQSVVTVEKDHNNKTIIKENGIATGAQG